MARAGAISATRPRSGAASGQMAPMTPTGSWSAMARACIGTGFTAPSNLSAQAAKVKSTSSAASTSAVPSCPVMEAIRSANSAARAERFSAT